MTMRAARENGIAQATSGVAAATTREADAGDHHQHDRPWTAPASPRRSRRLQAAPTPVPSSSENSVTVSE